MLGEKKIFELVAAKVLNLHRTSKRLVAFSTDATLCVLSTWIAFFLKFGEQVDLSNEFLASMCLSIALALPTFTILGFYQTIFRYSGWTAVKPLATAIFIYGLFYSFIMFVFRPYGAPQTIGLIQPLVLFFGVFGVRLFANFWLGGEYRRRLKNHAIPKALIYGAGAAGRQLVDTFSNISDLQTVGFIDDSEALHGKLINGVPIFSPENLPQLIAKKNVTHVLLAMPSISRRRRNTILHYVSQFQIKVRTLPSLVDLADGRVTYSDIKELDLDDLLDREVILPDQKLLIQKVEDKTVLVTGAGGSIGSELCRQILFLQPKTIILLEIGEYSLYKIHQELEQQKKNSNLQLNALIVPILCSVQESKQVEKIINYWRPDSIYHVAAYKHVPLVEQNLIEGVKNNVFGTLSIAQAAMAYDISNCVLISTDKAVRPTNVMGATKRLAEMVFQALNAEKRCKTLFSIVRFGNVLDSSGSVIPKFREQIRCGGPITLTHPEITRFFMTIPEAAQLVIQASSLAKGGDVFVLHMGEPIKIIDLATRMISLSGLSLRDDENPEGDISIEIIGLQPGEKLYEELLIEENSERTAHSKIMSANEKFLEWNRLSQELMKLKKIISSNDVDNGYKILYEIIGECEPGSRTSVKERKDNR